MADATTPSAGFDLPLAELAAREQLRLLLKHVARVPVAVLLVDALIVWLCARADLLWPGLAWFALSMLLQGVRAAHGRRLARRPHGSATAALRNLAWLYGVMGVARAVIVPVLFMQPLADAHYVLTMVMIGLAAGAVGSVAGVVRAYVLWSVPICAALALAWTLEGGFEGAWVAALLVLMFGVLTVYVRDQGRMIGQLVELAHEKDALATSLRVERDRAQAASDSKTRFFAAASHDLRQPLHALAINATTLELVSRKQADPVIKELSQSINRALGQSNNLLEGLLDISRLDANAVKVEIEPVDLASLLDTVRDEFAATASQRGLTLGVELPAAPVWIATDIDLMTRVLNNLVSNALKFTSSGGVTLSAAQEVGGEVLLVVGDTGAGIPPSEHERVFEEFYQIGNPSRDRSHGLGLGLSIVQRAAALLGVTLRLDSAPGRGTRVELRVPVPSVLEALPQAAVAESAPAEPDATPLPTTVLVLDDEEEILQALSGLLPQWGCEVRCAAGSAQALAMLNGDFHPQALLVDHRLRGETGPQAIDRIRARLGHVPAVVITGDTAPDSLLQLNASGFRVLHKPVDGPRLAQALAQALRDQREEHDLP